MQNSTVKNFLFVTLSSLSLLCLLLVFTASAPPKEYKLKASIPIDGVYMTTDHLSNAYVINKDNEVVKYNKEGDLVARFSEKRYGQLTSIDATSPFNILMFYEDFSTIVALDNQLNPKTLYRLPSLGINNVTAVGLSDDNYVWFFDNNESKLKKVNTKYEIIQESLAVNQLVGSEVKPNFILEKDRKVFVNDPELGVLVFDIFGNYYNSFPIGELTSFQVINNMLIFPRDGKLQIFNFTDFQIKSVPLPETVSEMKFMQIEKDILFVLNENELQIYDAL